MVSLYIKCVGIGFNVDNSDPTFCLNDAIRKWNQTSDSTTMLPFWTREKLLAKFCVYFESLMFSIFGDPKDLAVRNPRDQTFNFSVFADLYHGFWLHSDQLVYLEEEKMHARITSIDEQGYLKAILINDTLPVKEILLQPNNSSLDLMNGLIKLKP
jgi:biotin-(acetyl-CoA carboxylase) ligase